MSIDERVSKNVEMSEKSGLESGTGQVRDRASSQGRAERADSLHLRIPHRE